MSQIVLITGCSTGIGRDLVSRLTQSGYTVVATARKVESLAGLPAALCLPLDVTQPESVAQAVSATLERFGRIDVLINNAGYAVRGVLEETDDAQIQQMFDVNVHGVLRMIRAVVPHMRQQKSGRIINLSSIVGKLPVPVNGAYSATKFALEALSDALRFELMPFGVQVVLIEPGSIKTHFVETMNNYSQQVSSNPNSPYAALYQSAKDFDQQMKQNEPGPEIVSQVILKALTATKPKARYLAGVNASGRLVMHLGAAVWERVVRSMFKIKPAE